MSKPDSVHPIPKMVHSPKDQKAVSKHNRSSLVGLSLLGLFLVAFLFWQVKPVHALPGGSDIGLRTNNPASFELQGDRTPVNDRSNFFIPAQQVATTTLAVSIISSPWATVDSNGVPGVPDGAIPEVFVVEAVITNTGITPATGLVVTLDYGNPTGGWVLLAGEDPVRMLDELAPGAVYHAYWLARYPQTVPANRQYTVTAEADNASPVAASNNFYGNPAPGKTVATRNTVSSGNSGALQTIANVAVGLAFTVTNTYNLGTNPQDAIFSPVGNTDFDPSAYRLLASQVRFFNNTGFEQIITDRLYFPTVPGSATNAEVTYTFIALTPTNVNFCAYAAFNFSPPKYDENFCSTTQGTIVPITGTLSISLTKQASSLTVQQNQLLTYTLTYTNAGTQPLQGIWIWDDVPTNVVSIIPASIIPASDPDETTNSRVAWNIGNVPPGDTGTLTFSVLVDGNGQDLANGTSLINRAFLGVSLGGLPQRAALTRMVTTTVQAPTLAFSKTDGRATAGSGSLLTYTLRLTNSGSSAATGLVITDVLPANVTLAGPTTPNFNSQNGQILVWNSNLGPISPGGGVLAITIPVSVNSDVLDGAVLTNTATARYQNTAGYIFTTQTANDTTTALAPILSLSKTAQDLNGPPLVVSDTIRYTVRVTNTGSYTAFNVTVSDNLPAQVTCQSVSGDSPPASCADPLIWTLASLAPNSSASLNINVTVNPGSEGQTIINTVGVTSSNVSPPPPPPPVCPNGSQPVNGQCPTTPQPVETTLALSKTAQDLNGPPLVVSDTIRYTVRVTNTGSYTAFNVTVTDNLPAQVTCQSVSGDSPPAGCADPLIWTLASLAPNSSASLNINVTVNPGSEGQTIINTLGVTSTNVSTPPPPPPPVCPNGSQPVGGVCPVAPVPTTTLSLSKTAQDLNGPPLVVSDTIRYTVRVTNTGSYTAFNVMVTDNLPAQVTCQSVSGDSPPSSCADPLIWTLASLAPNSSASLNINVTVNPGSEGQAIINTAGVTSSNVSNPPPPPPPVCPDGSQPVNGQCPTTPEPVETTLALSKTAQDLNGPPLVVSDTIRYTVRVTNTGSYTAFNVTVTDDLPAQVTCQSVSGDSPPAGCADPLIWTLASLAPNSSATLNINVTINPGSEGQTIINTVGVTSTNISTPPPPPPPVCPNGSQPVGGVCPVTSVPTTTLSLSKTAQDLNGPPLVVNDTIRYTIRVTNTGSYTAFNVTVTDDLPAQVTCQSVSGNSPPAGCADPLIWTLASLAPNSSASLNINVTVNPGSEGQTITNTISVTSSNVSTPPPPPSPICPDGSLPVNGVCQVRPNQMTLLPIIMKQ